MGTVGRLAATCCTGPLHRWPAKNLTFGVYLTHIMVVAFLYNSLDKSFDFTVTLASSETSKSL